MSARSESHRSFKTWLVAAAAIVGVVGISEAPRIASWLSGYFNGKRNNTMVDIGTIRSNKDKVEDYCRMNQDVTIMDAARTALGLDKQ